MQKLSSLFACLFMAGTTLAQSIVIERIKVTGTPDNKSESFIPHAKDVSNPRNPVVEKINSTLIEVFDLDSFDPKQIEQFRWFDMDFESEIKSGIAWIRYSGEYLGAYPSPVEAELYFDLSTGELLPNHDIPFVALFTLTGYLDFLNKYWLTAELKNNFKESITCADGMEPYCTYYDINAYSVSNKQLTIALDSDCYPHVAQACSPTFSVTVPTDSVMPYLTDAAKKVLLTDRYTGKRGVEKYLYNKTAWKLIPDNRYLFGLINDKYAFSMAIAIQPGGATTGYYYYDRKKEKLTLKGTFANNIMDLTETVNNTPAGKFYFTFTDTYDEEAFPIYDAQGNATYLNGTWLSPDGAKKFKIRFTEVVTQHHETH